MQNYSSLVDRLQSRGGSAWDIHFTAMDAHHRGEDVIILSIGDPDFSTPSVISERAIKAILSGDTHYTEMMGRLSLREKIANAFNKTTQYPINANNVAVLAGTQNSLYCAAACLLDHGDEVLVPDPSYVTYEATLRASGADVVTVPTLMDQAFRLDLNALRASITPKTKAICFGNPSNPTGRVLDRDELAAIAALAREFDLWVISDEVYRELVFDKTYTSIRELDEMQERCVIVTSLSKSHAMTGWRAGWLIANPELVQHVKQLAMNMFYGLPGFIQQATETAIDHAEDITQDMTQRYRQRCNVVIDAFQQCKKVSIIPPDAGMFALLDIRALGMSASEFTWQLYKKTGVSTLDASAFGTRTSGFIRVSFANSEDNLAEASKRIIRFVEQL